MNTGVLKKIIPNSIIEKIRAIYYWNYDYYCPFCKGYFKNFNSFGLDFPVLKEKYVVGGGYRLNTACPNCSSSDRERLVYLYLKKKTDILKKKIKLLHIAPEKHLSKIFISSDNIKYIQGDKYNYSENTLKLDIAHIPFPDNEFDVIICNHVLEHVQNDRLAMSELFRVLKHNGWAILQVPVSLTLQKTYEDPNIISPKQREKAFGQSDHVRIYSKKNYINRLENTGFIVNIFNPFKENWNINIKKYAINPEEDIFVGLKK